MAVNEEVKWYYDEVLNSKGNAVEVGAILSNASADVNVSDTMTYRIKSSISSQEISDIVNNIPSISDPNTLISKLKNAQSTGKTWKSLVDMATEMGSAEYRQYLVNITEGYNEVNTKITYKSDKELTFTASMTEVSIGINNQWIEGNGADSMFSGSIDAMAQLLNGGAISGVTNLADQLGLSQKDYIRTLKRMNQQHYRSSTQFMKAFKGTNVSIPVSINRTFLHDQWGRTYDEEIKMISSFALGEEIDLSDWTNTDNLVNEAGKEEHVRSFMGGVASPVVSYVAKTGGVIQRGPLGYLYNAAAWRKMMNPTGGLIPGTCYIKFPNGIVIPDLLVSDMSIQMSSTQVLTHAGLRPLTITIAIQFMPCRTWGKMDALAILNYLGIDTHKRFL